MTSDTRFDIDVINKTLSFGYYSIQFGISLLKDYKYAKTRNTLKTAIVSTAMISGGKIGHSAGAAIGKLYYPGAGEWIGGWVVGMLVGFGAGSLADSAAEQVMDHFRYDVVMKLCPSCHTFFPNRRYQELDKEYCSDCRIIGAVLGVRS